MSTTPVPAVRAGGVVPVRVREGALQVALVHRPRYDDWSWPKGKLERGEDYPVAAVRETLEETGLRVRLGQPLPTARYQLSNGADKLVRYWAGEVLGGDGELEHEVDDVVWLSPTLARQRLSYPRDRQQLDAVTAAREAGTLLTWSFLVVRHAHALPRGDWKGPDPRRPLSTSGRRRARGRLASLLGAYAPDLVLSSPSARCADSVAPFVEAQGPGVRLVTKKGLSEEGFEAAPDKLDKHLDRVLQQAEPVAVCTHGPLLPRLIGTLLDRVDPALDPGDRRMLARLTSTQMDKGELLVCTMSGAGEQAQVVAVERHRPG
ncbi:NUDIX domain-containing protein [Ornithinimicrobium sp. LYQ92]|uniref:NUDIX hydrolase n=1 Tax=Serinicoccus sp. LYQ92 TaxID=3378798 RepID=UPI0038536526